MGPLIGLHMLFNAFIGLVVSIIAYRSTPPATAARERSKWFLYAFGTRDALWALIILAGLVSWAVLHLPDERSLNWELLAISVIVVYVPILAYGILKAQLFDIDLKIKWGAARGTVVVFIVITALIVAKTVEFYLNKTVGLVFGGIAAGLTLFFAPRLNKMADKVANKALPTVQPTSDYLTFKKLEVFRPAIESAMEAGGIDVKERDILERLRIKLGLKAEDASALEAELRAGASPAPAGTTHA